MGLGGGIDRCACLLQFRLPLWFQSLGQVPQYPSILGQFGAPRISLGLFLGMCAACVATAAESLGAYGVLAKVSEERHPKSTTMSRAILFEGKESSDIGTVFRNWLRHSRTYGNWLWDYDVFRKCGADFNYKSGEQKNYANSGMFSNIFGAIQQVWIDCGHRPGSYDRWDSGYEHIYDLWSWYS